MNKDIRICFIGDSFVNGTGDETALGWAGRLCAAANRQSQVTCYNLGIRRDTSHDILKRWAHECVPRLPPYCDGRIVMSFGVNDTLMENGRLRVSTQSSLTNIKQLLHDTRKYEVIAVGPPPVADDGHNVRIWSFSGAFALEAKAARIPYIDLFTPLSAHEAYKQEVQSNDGAHPKSTGYALMTQLIGSSPEWWFGKS